MLWHLNPDVITYPPSILPLNNFLHRCCVTHTQEASQCLKKHTQRIRGENQQLRRELQELIDVTSALQLHKKQLEKQYCSLLREHQFSQNLKQIRGSVFRGTEVNSDLQLGGPEQGSDTFLPQLWPNINYSYTKHNHSLTVNHATQPGLTS